MTGLFVLKCSIIGDCKGVALLFLQTICCIIIRKIIFFILSIILICGGNVKSLMVDQAFYWVFKKDNIILPLLNLNLYF